MKWLALLLSIIATAAQPAPSVLGSFTTFVVQTNNAFAIPTNAPLPFVVSFHNSGGWNLLSLSWKTNVPHYQVECSLTLSPWTNVAVFIVTNSGWPVTNHLAGFNVNVPGKPFGPPQQMFYRVSELP
jgi:hypothetical protein